MMRFALRLLLVLVPATCAVADLSNPSTLTIEEISPSRFSVELTLPVIEGRVLKAKPVIPDPCVAEGEPEVRGDASKAIRTWTMRCDPARLQDAAVGVQGLLGTSFDVQLVVETLDGRKYTEQLRPTRSYFVIPPPPTFVELAIEAGRRGCAVLLRRPELALLILVLLLGGTRARALVIPLLLFAAAQSVGQWLGGQRWMVMALFLPQIAAAATAWLLGVQLIGRPLLRPGWLRPLWVPMLLLGMMYGAASPETIAPAGLSTREQGLSYVLYAAGALLALALLTAGADQLRRALASLSPEARERWSYRLAYVAVVLAGALFFYGASAPWFGSELTPLVPPVTLVAVGALGLWCRRDHAAAAPVVAVAFAAGLGLSFRAAIPLASAAALGLLALVAWRLLFPRRWPVWLGLSVVAATAFFHGHLAGGILRQETTLPPANAAGMGVLLAALFFVCFRAFPAGERAGQPSLRVPGLVALALAVLWQLAAHWEWLTGPVASDLAMGMARLPLLAIVLLIAAWLAWPRKRRFASQPVAGANAAHWGLLALAFFALPLGSVRVDIPFHDPDAPSAAEARRVMATLLTDSYLAFNLPDEEAAFDRLARNLSQELVADVYLDSRRRLTAGTREGAEVTVREVSVTEVDAAIGTEGNAFTYPCQWVVTARVRHLQHIHNRQNVYVGRLTLTVEDDRWKIAGLDLLSEERVVLSWKSS